MLILHIGNKNYSSWSLRPWVLMRTVGIPFEERLSAFRSGVDFAAFSPTGLVPCLVDGPDTVWDSLAILEHLHERHEGVWPTDAGARSWARSASAEMHSSFGALRNFWPMSCGSRIRTPAPTAVVRAELDRIEQLWSEGLHRHGGPWLGGAAFSAVDAFYAPVAFRFQSFGYRPQQAALGDYVERLLALPAMREWYAAGLAETWRDEPHEVELAGLGELIEDLRAR